MRPFFFWAHIKHDIHTTEEECCYWTQDVSQINHNHNIHLFRCWSSWGCGHRYLAIKSKSFSAHQHMGIVNRIVQSWYSLIPTTKITSMHLDLIFLAIWCYHMKWQTIYWRIMASWSLVDSLRHFACSQNLRTWRPCSVLWGQTVSSSNTTA